MRIASALSLVVSGLVVTAVSGQAPAPQAYTLSAEATSYGNKFLVTIYRDGSTERVETVVPGAPGKMSTIYDFEAKKVYWIMDGPQPTCTSGRYLSARAPISEDPVTGSAQMLAALPKGTQRRAVGSEPVNGIPARIEALTVPAGAAPKDAPVPSRVWLSEADGMVVRIEGAIRGGKPATMFEVKRFALEKPTAALLAPPAGCQVTNAEMDDSGMMRAHGEATIDAKASGEANLADQTGHSAASAGSSQGKMPAPASAAAITAVTLQSRELPGPAPCGRKLQVAATVTVDGPATVWYRFHTTASGLAFSGGALGTVRLAAAGTAKLSKDVTFPAGRSGEIRLETRVQAADGRRGPATDAEAVTFQVACAAGPPGR